MGFIKGIKREIAAYPSLKDKRYFDGFKRSLFMVAAKSHKVLDPTYTPVSEPEQKSCSKPNKLLCLVSLMLTFRLTWVDHCQKTLDYHRFSISLERAQRICEDLVQGSLREKKTHPICHQYCSKGYL